MANKFIESKDITSEWLSHILETPIQIIDRQANTAFNSDVVHLTIQHAAAPNPERLLIKLNANHDGEYEVKFYQRVKPLAASLPMLPRIGACDYDSESGRSYLVLEDLSFTHAAPVTREDLLARKGIPSDAHLLQVTEAIAAFHAYWWQHSDLKAGALPIRSWYGSKAEFEAHVQRRQREWETFTATVTDFPEDLRTLYTSVLAQLPHLWTDYLEQRVTSLSGLTLSHGDCYLTQFLCPREETANQQAFMVDFQEASGNFGAFDLVFMFATFWTPEQRHANNREARLLRHYHQILGQQGVTGYTWEDLMRDYRLMLTLILFFPIFDAVSGAPYEYWWPKMECLVSAFRDLDCANLILRTSPPPASA